VESGRCDRVTTLVPPARGSEELFRLLVAGVVDYAIITLDVTCPVTSWNPGAERIKGWTAQEIMGRSFETFYQQEEIDAGKCAMELRECARTGSFEDEGWRLRADGTRFWANVVITAMRDPQGHLIGFSKLTRDMTERRANEESVRALNADLERRVQDRTALLTAMNEELESFTYSVSHDLRAPLRAIDGFLSIVRSEHADGLDEEGTSLLAEVSDNARRMGRLIDDLLEFSRLQHTELAFNSVRTQLLVERLVARLRSEQPDRELDITIQGLPDVRGDEILLAQVFDNLVRNAVKYSRAGQVPAIVLRGREVVGGWEFEVSDHGVGFDQAYSGKLFGVFQRLHRADEYEGTGVGLAIVKRIVTRHGGRVWATGTVGEGARFGFSLSSGEL
jgi:PAS domain S-box-containing protein